MCKVKIDLLFDPFGASWHDIQEGAIAAEGEGELSHDEAVPLLAPYLAGKLRRSQAEAVRKHLAVCMKCARRIGRRRARRSVET